MGEQGRFQRWTIHVCPECGKRFGGAYWCRAHFPAVRAHAVEVVPAELLRRAYPYMRDAYESAPTEAVKAIVLEDWEPVARALPDTGEQDG